MKSICIFLICSFFIFACSTGKTISKDKLESSDSIKSSQRFVDAGKHFMNKKEFSQAKLNFLKASELDPDNSEIWGLAGVAAKNNSEYDEAINLFSRAIEARPTDYRAYGNIGNIYHRLKKYDEAIKAFLKVIELNDKDYRAPMHLADIYYEIADYDKCRFYIKEAGYSFNSSRYHM